MSPDPGDPFESTNRQIHAFNKGLDTFALRPASQVYGTLIPEPVRNGISNFADNLGLPATIINNTLQGDFGSAASNTGRFLVNTTFGLAGVFDPSTALGVPEESTDFGETLHVWGAGEGVFLELPFLGASTTRDAAGRAVDILIDPLGYVLEVPEVNYSRGSRFASGLNSRFRFTVTIDGILYESADSYAQSRIIYLQNRRFELGTSSPSVSLDEEGDLYDDFFLE
ncbi:MAG: VacJ family lipoprotein [Pseudomonadota bacterium]